jgi:hypothetical protein
MFSVTIPLQEVPGGPAVYPSFRGLSHLLHSPQIASACKLVQFWQSKYVFLSNCHSCSIICNLGCFSSTCGTFFNSRMHGVFVILACLSESACSPLTALDIGRLCSQYGDPASDPSLALGTWAAMGNVAGNHFESCHASPPATSGLTLSPNRLVVFHAACSYHPGFRANADTYFFY